MMLLYHVTGDIVSMPVTNIVNLYIRSTHAYEPYDSLGGNSWITADFFFFWKKYGNLKFKCQHSLKFRDLL